MSRDTASAFVRVLSPFTPHVAEELWEQLGHPPSVADAEFPAFNEEYLKEDRFEYPVSFNGKLRFKLELPVDMEEDRVREAVLNDERSARWLDGKNQRK